MKTKHTPIVKRGTRRGGSQGIYRFPNNFGASVVCDSFSYGGEEGLKELGVIKFKENSDNWSLTYDTPITSDVIGHLTDDDVDALLDRIADLPKEII